jgi:hypothetical protein
VVLDEPAVGAGSVIQIIEDAQDEAIRRRLGRENQAG